MSNTTVIKKEGMVVEISDDEVIINGISMFSTKGIADYEKDPEIVIEPQFCKAANAGGSTTVVYVDDHLFDHKEFLIEINLRRITHGTDTDSI